MMSRKMIFLSTDTTSVTDIGVTQCASHLKMMHFNKNVNMYFYYYYYYHCYV